MASKTGLSTDNLKELGVEKLAVLIIDEAKANAAFRKRVSAALAGMKGPEAVAKLVERRLSALEKARSAIDWHKIKDFEKDLSATLATITGELGEASPIMAMDLLLRFIATGDKVFNRLDGSSRVENLYDEAAAAIGPLASRLGPADLNTLSGKMMTALGDNSWHLAVAAEAVMPHLPPDALVELDGLLRQRVRSTPSDYIANRYRQLRQVLANHQGDFDKWIALENEKPDHARDRLAVAELLLAAGRAKEALAWVEQDKPSRSAYSDYVDIADGAIQRDPKLRRRAGLKAGILEALDQKEAAQALRWTTFEQTLDGDLLRVYIGKLDDFAEFDALDKAFAHALDSKSRYRALLFLAQWPRLDLAAKLVVDRHAFWDGEHYQVLSPAADLLRDAQPLAATILYRALVENMLTKGRSAAYGHGARYVKILDELAPQLDGGALQATGRLSPKDWLALLRKTHGRKASFWAGVS
jgi:hypothetical protein